MVELFRISKGREFQMIGAATENCETQNLCCDVLMCYDLRSQTFRML